LGVSAQAILADGEATGSGDAKKGAGLIGEGDAAKAGEGKSEGEIEGVGEGDCITSTGEGGGVFGAYRPGGGGGGGFDVDGIDVGGSIFGGI